MTIVVQAYPFDLLPPRELAQAGARGILTAVKRNFLEHDKTAKHREGWTPRGYWGQAANATRTDMDGNTGVVEVDKEGVALHWWGGSVYPKSSKALAIPVNPAAGDRRPAEVDPSRRLFNLVKTDKSATLRHKETGEVWWVLLKSVFIPADKSVLPTDDAMYQAASDAILDYMEAQAS